MCAFMRQQEQAMEEACAPSMQGERTVRWHRAPT